MKKFRGSTVVAVLLMLALVLTACSKKDEGSSGGGGSSTAASQQAFTADQYATAVCGALDSWLTDIKSAGSSLPANMTDPSQAKDALVQFLDGLVTSTETMVSTVQEAGASYSQGNADAKAAIEESLGNVKTIFANARDQISNLDTTNAKAFGQALQQIGTDMQSAASAATSSLNGITDQELNGAFAGNPACTSLGMSTSGGSSAASPAA